MLDKELMDKHNNLEVEEYLKIIENNKMVLNSLAYLDTVLYLELYRILNILYLDCKDDYDSFNKDLFKKTSNKLYQKIHDYYQGLVKLYEYL